MERLIAPPTSTDWGHPPLPEWVSEFRDHQIEAVDEILEAFERTNVVMLDAPTGSGKTLIGELTRRLLGPKGIYTCTTKSLQDQFCVAPETRVLTGDLRYIPAGDVEPGDLLLGFDEERSGTRRMFRPAEVLDVATIQRPCYKLTFDDGTEIVCSSEHRWLVGVGQTAKWLPTERLRVHSIYGSKVYRIVDTWEQGGWDYERGYLAAAFDGEGHLHQGDPARGNGADVNLSFAQRDNEMLAVVKGCLDEMGFPYKIHWDKTGCARLLISGRKEILRFLGQVRPPRLLPQLDLERLGMIGPARASQVISKEFIGTSEVMAIKTSTGTFIAEGLASHNCKDFPYSKVVKGRSNYPTENFPNAFPELSCDDCEGQECSLCEVCPYKMAKFAAVYNELPVLNLHYLLAEGNQPRSQFRGRQIIIVDEADVLESVLMSHVEVRISRAMQKRWGISMPEKKTVPSSWQAWVDREIPRLANKRDRLDTDDRRQRKQKRQLDGLLANMRLLQADLRDDDATNWVYTDYETGNIVFKPVTVDKLAPQFLWGMGHKFLLMSASLISAGQMAADLGIDDYEYVTVESTFPVENRPVRIAPVAAMTKATYEAELPKMIEAVRRVVAKHEGERVLIHTVSYKLAKDVSDGLKGCGRPVFTYTEAAGRDAALDLYLATDGAVMVASSLDRGVDLPGDACRCQIICKVPYPYLGDKQVAARLHSPGGQTWYEVQTARTLVQMTGRGVRSATDTCTTYILDKSFMRFYSGGTKRLFPAWWDAAVDWGGETLKELTK